MKTKLIFLLTCIFYVSIYGQINLEEHIIAENADEVISVFAADIDDDGDMDVTAAYHGLNRIVWLENIDGQGTFIEHNIKLYGIQSCWVFAIDMDKDGDMDVISAQSGEGTVAWHENYDGQGETWYERVITNQANIPDSIFATDFDGDNDNDVLVSCYGSGMVVWYENKIDQGVPFEEHIITTNAVEARSVYAADFDGDGYIDALSGSKEYGEVVWYKNDGQGNFTTQPTITSLGAYTWSIRVSAGNLNGDGYIDVLAHIGNGKTVWCENDGQGNFVEHIMSEDDTNGESICIADIDDDGDNDVFVACWTINTLVWYENTDGLGNFDRHIITDQAPGVRALDTADINDDGLLDIISGWWTANKVVWHKQFILDIDENNLLDFSVYPIPTTAILTIEADFTIAQIDIYNQLGQLVSSNTDKNTIDISTISQGLYFCKIKDENGNTGTRKVVKK